MADESMVTEQNLRTLIEDESVDFVNIKLMKNGGIYPVYKLATQAKLFGISCQIASMVESSIASAAGFHVALAKDNIISTEISGPTKFIKDPGDLSYDLPFVKMTGKPGLGIEVDEETLEELTIKNRQLEINKSWNFNERTSSIKTLWEDLHELAEVSYKEFETTVYLLKYFKEEGFSPVEFENIPGN